MFTKASDELQEFRILLFSNILLHHLQQPFVVVTFEI